MLELYVKYSLYSIYINYAPGFKIIVFSTSRDCRTAA